STGPAVEIGSRSSPSFHANIICESSTKVKSKMLGVHSRYFCVSCLAIHRILDRIPQVLHLTHQPGGGHRQAKRADQEGDHQQDDAVLRRVGNQNRQSQQRHHRGGQAEDEAGHIQQPEAHPGEQCQRQHHRRGGDLQHQFQNKYHSSHFSASFRQSRYGWHSSSTALSSASVASRRPFVRQTSSKSQ